MIRMGIIGAGRIAAVIAKTIRMMRESGIDRVELYGVASRSGEKARAFAAEYGAEKSFASYEALVADTSVDLVYIATPHSHHARHIRLCLEGGKHVLCEKAFTANAAEAKLVVDLAREKKLLLAEAIWTRYQPMRKIIAEAVASKIAGEAKMLTANLSYSILHKERIVRPELAGGALLDVGIYALNFAEMIFGRSDGVQAVCQKNAAGVDIHDSITLTYGESGRLAILAAGADAVSDRYGMIYCTDGFIQIENINNPQKISVFNKERTLVKEEACPAQLTGYEYELIEAADAIEAGKIECPSMPLSETLHMMELMDEIRRIFGVRYPFE